jgi:hypothetical protein
MTSNDDLKSAETVGPEDLVLAENWYRRVSHLADELGVMVLCKSGFLAGLEAGRRDREDMIVLCNLCCKRLEGPSTGDFVPASNGPEVEE